MASLSNIQHCCSNVQLHSETASEKDWFVWKVQGLSQDYMKDIPEEPRQTLM